MSSRMSDTLWKYAPTESRASAWNVERARSGTYTQFEVQRGLPIRMLVDHFDKQDEVWRANAKLRQAIHWRKLNLMGDFRGLGPFDVVFCRNVLPYFDPDTRRSVLEKSAPRISRSTPCIPSPSMASE